MSASTGSGADLPRALVEEPRGRSWAWLLPLFALALAVWLVLQARTDAGLLVSVRAEDGHGIAAGDAVRHRGIDVGRVEAVRLSTGLDEVVLDLRLAPFATGLARRGTQFWIARPHVALESVAGLETLFGARYVALVAGPPGGAPQRGFQALEDPPLSERFEPSGLELVLEAPARFGLAPGAPLQHRGVDVGSVVAVGLADDGARVEVQVYVRPEYAGLVRENSVFWEVGGAELTVGLTQGLRLDVDSLRGLLVGGVVFATPDDPGARVEDGQRFPLEDEPEADAGDWRPALGVGRDLEGERAGPRPVTRALGMRWSQGVFRSDREREGWGLVLDGFLVAPEALVVPPAKAREGSLEWSFAGQVQPLFGPPARRRGDLVAIALPAGAATEEAPPEVPLRRALGAPEPCLVVGDSGAPPIALDVSRLTAAGERWSVDPELSLPLGWTGAPVLARSDGALLGLLVVSDDEVEVAPLP